MPRSGQKLLAILLLSVMIMMGGIFLTYQAMARTTGWPVPPLVQFKSTSTHWELEAIGAEYALSKEALQPQRLKAKAEDIILNAARWSRPLLKEGLQVIREAAAFLREQLLR